MEREVKLKPIAHIYAFAAVWVIWAMFLPMYKLWHFIVLLLVSLFVGFLFSKLFPGKRVKITIPEPEPEPFTSGNPEVDAVIREGELAVSEMKRLRTAIEDEKVRIKVSEIIEISEKIVKNVQDDHTFMQGVKRFLNYYLPTTIKLLNAYDRMYDQGITGENISGSMEKIDEMLDTLIEAYKKQLDSLFARHALDIETDIEVMEGMLKREGLTGNDFNRGEKKNER